jgi:hypothetical protein
MAIIYVISGTRPNLSIQATDGYATVVTVAYNTNDSMQTAYDAIRQAFIDAYVPTISFECEWSGTGTTRTCQSTDSHANVITHTADITQSSETIRRETIGKFVDFYGMSDDNALYQHLDDYPHD